MIRAYEAITEVLLAVKEKCVVGAIPTELDKFAEEKMLSLGAKPFNKGYHPDWAKTPYPAVLCINRKGVIAHGIPDNKPLENGEMIAVDTSLTFNHECADAAFSIGIGEVDKKLTKMIRDAKTILLDTINNVVRDGVSNYAVGKYIEDIAKQHGYVTSHTMSGHGIGTQMHESPIIPNFNPFRDRRVNVPMASLRAGQIVCIEPMITKRDTYGKMDSDSWTYKTPSGKYSCFFEHMVLVGKEKSEILTKHI